MRRLIAVSSLALGALVLAPTAADAWNKPGHMVTATIAFQELQQRDPQTLAAVLDLLRRHPHHARWLDSLATDPTATPADQDAFVFMYAARWADDVRDSPSLHCERCHFINFPFKPAGQPASVPTFPPRPDNVIVAFENNLDILRTSTSVSERAKALTWIFHLVGDVHQPLHTTSLYSTDYRERDGDRGGNSFFVREQPTFEPTRLHSFWDGLVLKGASAFRFRTVQDRAASLRGTFPRDTFPELPSAASSGGPTRRASTWPCGRATSRAPWTGARRRRRTNSRARCRCSRPATRPTAARSRRSGPRSPGTAWPRP